jgi:hypothetical protein
MGRSENVSLRCPEEGRKTRNLEMQQCRIKVLYLGYALLPWKGQGTYFLEVYLGLLHSLRMQIVCAQNLWCRKPQPLFCLQRQRIDVLLKSLQG